MKLRNIYLICCKNSDALNNLTALQKRLADGTVVYQIKGWNDVRTAIVDELMEVKYLQEEAQALLDMIPQVFMKKDSFEVSSSDWSEIQSKRNTLLRSMEDVIYLYESMGFETDSKIGLDVKLPKCEDFSEFKKCIDELEFILYKCPIFKVKDETLKFDSVDVGSMWITFFVVCAGTMATSVILNNIAAFIDKCYVIKSHKITLEQQKMQLKKMELDEKTKELYQEGLEKIYQETVKSVVEDLAKKTEIKLKDGEEEGFVTQAFDKAIVLLDKGMQIYSTLDTPKEVQALFQPLEMKYIDTEKAIKKITQKEENEKSLS